MSGLTDLKAATASIAAADTANQAAIQSAITLINQLRTAPVGSVADADVEAVVTQLNTAAADFSQATTNLSNALTPPGP